MQVFKMTIIMVTIITFLFVASIAGAESLFEDIADVPANLNLPTAATVGEDIYLVSGWDLATGWTKKMYRYNIPTDTWSTTTPSKASLPDIYTPRTEACNTGYMEDKDMFCVIGGQEGNGQTPIGPTDAVECYDVQTNSWSTEPSLPVAVAGAYCAVHEGVIYVTGGLMSGSAYNTDLWWFDTNAKIPGWSTASSSRPMSSAIGAGAITKDPYVSKTDAEYRFSQLIGTSPTSTHWGLTSEAWSTTADFQDRVYPCVIADGDYNTMIIGGADFQMTPPYPTYDDVVTYDSMEDQWTTADATMPLSRAAMACAEDDLGNIYLFAGYSTDDKAGKDLKLGRRYNSCLLRFDPLNTMLYNGGWLYLSRNVACGHWIKVLLFFYMLNTMIFQPAPADYDVAENGVARVKVDVDDGFLGPGRILGRDTDTGRVGTSDITIGLEPEDEDKNIFYADFEGLRLGIGINWNNTRWDVEEEEPATFSIRLSFKDDKNKAGEGQILEANDPDEAGTGEIWSPIWPATKGTFTYKWDAYFDSGDGLSMYLYADVVNNLSEGLVVHMLEGGVSVELPDAKGVNDCNVTLATGQWYKFSFALDLDNSLMTLSVDGVQSQCNALAVPFSSSTPVQGLGFVMPDDLTGGITYVDNIEVLGFEDPPVDDDDDDDATDDDDLIDDDDTTAPVDDDDDDDDGGCCGC